MKAPSRKLQKNDNKIDRSAIKSAGQVARQLQRSSKQEKPTDVAQRVKSAELQHAPTKMDRINEEVFKSLLHYILKQRELMASPLIMPLSIRPAG